METEEETPRTTKLRFRYNLARAAVDDWVGHLDHPNVNWAWEIIQRTAEVYGELGRQPGESAARALAAVGYDFFDAWHAGSANHGIIGVMQELASACPESHIDDLARIMELAWEAGRSGVAVPHGARNPRCDESGEGARDGRDGVPALTVVRGGAAEAPPRPRSRAGAPQLGLVPPVDA